MRTSTTLAVAALLVAFPALADTVKLKTGQTIKGKVIDRGAYVIVEKDFEATPKPGTPTATPASAPGPRPTASIRIERQDIASIEIDGQEAQLAKDLDVVVFVNGDELPGHVEIRDGGKNVVIVGAAGRGEVVLDARQVRTVLWSQKSQEALEKGQSVGGTIQKLLDDLKSPDATAKRTARDRLYSL
ncbi:MAG TPA: hypothetical protein VHF22_00685, partial [Planctomycetota bacterium]|nr:hypothetical protein [Planctomycetota bacterium]